MKITPLLLAVFAALVITASSARAADGSWNVNSAGNWIDAGNWTPGIPGDTTTDSTDIATFSFSLGGTRAVTVDADRFIGGIRFGNTSNFGYSLETGTLRLNSGGVIETLAGNGNHTDTISAPIVISGVSGAAATFTAGATSATSLLSIGAVTGSATATNTTTLTLNGTNTRANTITGIIGNGSGGGNLALVKSGAGTWVLPGVNTFTGGVAINAGTLRVTSAIGNGDVAGSLGAASSAASNLVIDGGILEWNPGAGPSETSNRGITIGTNGGTIFANPGGNNGLALTGPLVLSGSGSRTITLRAVASNRVNSWSANIGDQGGATALVFTNTFADTTSSWNLTGGLTFTGGLSLTGGGGVLNLNGNGTYGFSGGVNVGAGSTLNTNRAGIFSNDIINNGTLGAITQPGIITYSGIISGTGRTSFSQANVIFSATNNSYTGSTTFAGNVGTQVLEVSKLADGGQNSSIGASTSAASNLVLGLNTGGSITLRYVGSGDTTDRLLTLTSNGGGTLGIQNNGSGALQFTNSGSIAYGTGDRSLTFSLAGDNGGNNTFAPTIADNGTGVISLSKSGTGTWAITGNNTYTGATSISGGILVFQTTQAKAAGTVTAAAAGSIGLGVGGSGDYSSADVDSLFANTLTGFDMDAASGVAIDTTGGDFTYATNQSALRALTKLGANTLTLTGANTYTGATNVSAGTLIVNGIHSGTGSATVSFGATLGGIGTLAGATTVNGIIAPGNSIGQFNITNNVTWNGTASNAWEFELGAANSADLLNITGDFLKGTGSSFVFDFANTGQVGTFKLVEWSGTTGFASTDFSYTNLGGSNSGTFAFDGSQLEIVVVPEPSTLVIFTGALLALIVFRRSRRMKA